MTTTYRVRFEDETDPTFPDSWGWTDDETNNFAGWNTPSNNYLHHVAADLIAETSA